MKKATVTIQDAYQMGFKAASKGDTVNPFKSNATKELAASWTEGYNMATWWMEMNQY